MGQAASAGAAVVATPEQEVEDDLRLEAVVEPPRPPVVIPQVAVDPQEALGGRYDDGFLSDSADRNRPDAWKKAPFLLRIVEFLFYMSTLPRWIMYSIGLAAVLNLGYAAVASARGGLSEQVLAIFLSGIFAVTTGFFLTSFAAVLLAIVNDTANGMDEVESWPDWNIFDWIVNSVYFPAAAFVAGLPGAVVAAAILSVAMDPLVAGFTAVGPVVLSLAVLFPLVLFSMLAEGSITAPYSPQLVRSFHTVSEGWMLFYLYSFALGIFGGCFAGLAAFSNPLLNCLGAVLVVTAILIYCRLLGRLMWYVGEKEAKLEQAASCATPVRPLGPFVHGRLSEDRQRPLDGCHHLQVMSVAHRSPRFPQPFAQHRIAADAKLPHGFRQCRRIRSRHDIAQQMQIDQLVPDPAQRSELLR